MGLINPNKKYKSLSTFGCSYTTGFLLGEPGSWGHHLAKLLNCVHTTPIGAQSNPNILNAVIRYCETNDMTDCCVGIEWSEITRRETWNKKEQKYDVFGVGDFDKHERNKSVINDKNIEYFTSMWFDLNENVLRTVNSIILAKNYLLSKNIDFVMFEGINSIMDVKYDRTILKVVPEVNLRETILVTDEYKKSLLDDVTFFSKLGDWHHRMLQHPLHNPLDNNNHPNMDVVKWWVGEIYDYLLVNSNSQ